MNRTAALSRRFEKFADRAPVSSPELREILRASVTEETEDSLRCCSVPLEVMKLSSCRRPSFIPPDFGALELKLWNSSISGFCPPGELPRLQIFPTEKVDIVLMVPRPSKVEALFPGFERITVAIFHSILEPAAFRLYVPEGSLAKTLIKVMQSGQGSAAEI